MNLDRVPPGKNVPNDCNVIIEVPTRADAISYTAEQETGAVFVDRLMAASMDYPCDDGDVPRPPDCADSRSRPEMRIRGTRVSDGFRRRGPT